MLPHFCLLTFLAASNAAAVTTFKQLCDQPGCGDYNVFKEKGSSASQFYTPGDKACYNFNITISEDEKMVSFEYGSFTNVLVPEGDDCIRNVVTSSVMKEVYLKLAGTCDEVFLDVVCYADPDTAPLPFLISRAAPTECVKKALKVLECNYGAKASPGLAETTCGSL